MIEIMCMFEADGGLVDAMLIFFLITQGTNCHFYHKVSERGTHTHQQCAFKGLVDTMVMFLSVLLMKMVSGAHPCWSKESRHSSPVLKVKA